MDEALPCGHYYILIIILITIMIIILIISLIIGLISLIIIIIIIICHTLPLPGCPHGDSDRTVHGEEGGQVETEVGGVLHRHLQAGRAHAGQAHVHLRERGKTTFRKDSAQRSTLQQCTMG